MARWHIVLLVFLAVLIAGCVNPLPGTCQPKGDSCCKLGVCTVTDVLCVEGTQPVFSGCSKDCTPIVKCVPGATAN